MDQQFADWMTTVGDHIDHHLGSLSHDVLGLRIDGRGQRLGVHAGLHFITLDEDVHMVGNVARVQTRLTLEAGSHVLDLKLPAVELQPDDYHGEHIVELRGPLLERRW